MIELQRYVGNDAPAPSVRFNFDETAQESSYAIVQYFVDFLSATGHDATVISNLQTVIDTNTQ